MKKNIIVIGGGILGIFCALYFKKKNKNVTLIEQNNKIGGLFNSIESKNRIFYDHGCHFARETGVKKIDRLLFNFIDEREWRILGNLKYRGFYKSKLSKSFGALDARLLKKKDYLRSIKEFLRIKKLKNNYKNLSTQLVNTFGNTITEKIFKPIIEDKITGIKLDKLPKNFHKWAGMGRLIMFSENLTNELKKRDVFDQRIAYHNTEHGQSKLRNFYPKNKGMGYWINLLEKKLIKLNVNIIKGHKIRKIVDKNNKINHVVLENGKKIECSKLIWTVHPGLLPIKKKITTKENKDMKKIYLYLFHFAFNKKLIPDAHFIQCYDPKFKTYRVTLYPNIINKKDKYYNLTSELIFSKKKNISKLKKIAIKELIKIGIIKKNYKLKDSILQELGKGIPVPSIENLKNINKLNTKYRKRFKNMVLLNLDPLISTGQNLINTFNFLNKND